MATEKEALAALDNIVSLLAESESDVRAAGVPDLGSLCKKYSQIKPLIEPVLWLIGRLPNGQKIVSAIRLLLQIADVACPVN